MEGDERSCRVALVAAELVNPMPGAVDALAVLDAAGWGVLQLPPGWYPADVAAPLLEQMAEQVEEFDRHGYDVVLVGERAGVREALAALGVAAPDAIVPRDAGELTAFLQSRPTVTPR